MPKVADLQAELSLKKDKYDKAMKDAGSAPNKLGSAFSDLGKGIASAFTVGAIIEFAKKSAEAYNIQAQGEAALLQALGGRVTVQKELLNQASELQNKTLFDDDATSAAMKQLAVMKLNGDQIKMLIPVIQDFATIQKMDLETSAKLVAKSIGTSTNALGRYGIEIDNTMSIAEKASEIQRVFNERYGGQAQLAASVGTGSMTILTNAFGDFTEIVGKLLAQNTQGYFLSMAESMGELNKQLSSDVLTRWEKFVALVSKVASENDPTGMIAPAVNMILNQKIKENEGNQRLIDGLQTLNNLRKNAKQLIAEEVAALQEKKKLENQANEANRLKKLEEENKRLKDIRDSYREINDGILKMNESMFMKNPFMKSIDSRPESTLGLQGGMRNQFMPDFDNAITEAEDKAIEFMDSMNQSMQQFTADFIGTFAEGIGQLMSGNIGLDQFFNSILGAFGGFISQMGKMLIAYGIGMSAFKKAFTNPFAAIAAGIALTVIGGLISGLASKGPSMSGSTGGMTGGGGYSGGGSEYGYGIGGNGGQLVAVVKGSDLEFILQRAGRNSGRIGM